MACLHVLLKQRALFSENYSPYKTCPHGNADVSFGSRLIRLQNIMHSSQRIEQLNFNVTLLE
jgi:hypothetical protein